MRKRNEIPIEGEENAPEEEKEELGKKVPKAKYEALEKELVKAKEDLAKESADKEHWKNEYYRAYADTQNLRRTLEAEQRDIRRYRGEGFIDALLPALDGFHMALESPVASKEIQNYLVGFQYIYNQIVKVFNDEGVTEISPKEGDAFNLDLMQAVETVEDEEKEPGTVVKILSKGYKLHDHLIRPAMVVVTKKKAEISEEPNDVKEDAVDKKGNQA